MSSIRDHRRRPDTFLLPLGLLGWLGFFLFLPSVALDGAADFSAPEAALVESATRFLIDQGYDGDGLVWDVHPRRAPVLLDSLQMQLGRREAMRRLREPDGLPAFHWFVRGYEPAPSETSNQGIVLGEPDQPEGVQSFELRMDREARVRWFHGQVSDRLFQAVNRATLFKALPDTGRTARIVELLKQWPDSTLLGALLFQIGDSLGPGGGPPPSDGPDRRPPQRSEGPRFAPLREADAVRIARTHLEALLPGEYGFVLDTLYTAPDGVDALPLPAHIGRSRGIAFTYEPDRAAAVALFSGTDPGTGLPLRTRLAFTAGGLLLYAQPDYAPVIPSDEDEGFFDDGLSADMVSILLFIVLAVFVIVLFFRRLSARLIDVKSALQDALMGGIFLALVVGLSMGKELMENNDSILALVVIWTISTVLAASIGAFLTFIVSSATDAHARMTWPQKLLSLTFARNFNFFNVHSGLSLLRGILAAGVILGAVVGMLALLGNAPLMLEGDDYAYPNESLLSSTGFFIGLRGWLTQLLLLTVLLGVGPELTRRFASSRTVYLLLGALLTLVNLSPVSLWPTGLTFVLSAVVAVAVTTAFWQYDFLTSFVALMMFGLMWDTAPGWLPAGIPAFAESVGAWLAPVGALVLGLVGLLSGRSGAPEEAYRPAYLRELAQQERLRGELETAHRVQASFLPTRMPRIAGADIAALCLPAQEVGGDYYDFISIDDHRLAVVIGDVSGKGIQAAFYMTLTKGFLRALCREVESPATVLSRVNILFCENAPRGMFISMIYGILDTRACTFTFVRAGHDPVIARRKSERDAEYVRPGGMAIGLVAGAAFDEAIHETVIHLRDGDVLAFYTDGCTDALNAERQPFGSDRMLAAVAETPDGSASDILAGIVAQINGFAGATSRPDDLTVVVLRIGSPAAPASRHVTQQTTHV
jgi:serine phosphatase RsbU (regulator of sigma subunit)